MTQWPNKKMPIFNNKQYYRATLIRINHKNNKLNKNAKSKKKKKSLLKIKDLVSYIFILI